MNICYKTMQNWQNQSIFFNKYPYFFGKMLMIVTKQVGTQQPDTRFS